MNIDDELREIEERVAGHTPGPWERAHRECDDGMYRTQVYSAEHGVIATCEWTPKPLPNGVIGTYREANATFIAAAPDLLRIARQAVDQLEEARGVMKRTSKAMHYELSSFEAGAISQELDDFLAQLEGGEQ